MKKIAKNKTNNSEKEKYDKEKYLMDLASTPLISIGLGQAIINPSDYIIEEIKFDNN